MQIYWDRRRFTLQKSPISKELALYTNLAAISLFRKTNMVAVTSSLKAVQASFHMIICNFSIVPAREHLAIGEGNEYEDLMET